MHRLTARRRALLVASLALPAALTAGCGASGNGQEVPETVSLTVTATSPVQADVEQTLALSGAIAPWQELSIGAELAGTRISAILVDIGDRVHAGQVLVRLDDRLLRAQLREADASVKQARAALELARSNAARGRQLAASGHLSGSDAEGLRVDEIRAEAALATAEAAAESARLRLHYATIVAPDAGIVSARLAQPGHIVGAGEEILRLIRRGRLEWRAEATAEELAGIVPGAGVEIDGPAGIVQGSVRALAPQLSNESRTGLVYADLPDPGGLRAGAYVRGRIRIGAHPALLVPQEAIVSRDGHALVFLAEPIDIAGITGELARVRARRVSPGNRVGTQQQIRDGLNVDQQIVVAGAGFLNDGDIVRITRP